MSYNVGTLIREEWLSRYGKGTDIGEILREQFQPGESIRIELFPDLSELYLHGQKKSEIIRLKKNNYSQHYGFFRLDVLKQNSPYWCGEMKRGISSLVGSDESIFELIYYPDYALLRLISQDPPQDTYVSGVTLTVT